MTYQKYGKKKHQYELNAKVAGWTRIEMLLAIYDKAIVEIKAVQENIKQNKSELNPLRLLEIQKCILALHSGLKPDEESVAEGVARLLNFIMFKIENSEFDVAEKFLTKLRNSFAQIRDEANELEKRGVIPALQTHETGVSSLV